MTIENLDVGIALAIWGPIFYILFSGIIIKRHENCLREFYFVLREKHPKFYVKQNKVTKSIRQLFKIKTDGTIHLLVAIFHYEQIGMLLSPLYMLIALIFLPIERSAVIAIVAANLLFVSFFVTIEIFTLIEMIRCEIIKKKCPEHSQKTLYRWTR